MRFTDPLGADAQGRIMYTPEGTMMAILMRSDRPNFNASNLASGTAAEKDQAISSYVSYSGTYRTEGDRVIHSVQFSLLPNWVGTDLVRIMTWDGDDLILTTEPAQTRSGRELCYRLRWRKLTASLNSVE